ncbi:SDR family oxidoreductase [Sphingobacterium psychroaquaticum]|uniref:dTDP-4-dehydrorhamnose reductase n=1 Tax=Sphingobacterium psychroaquaticum TaxID=561061 RepID=A0A1X7L8N7_9SPHI|nr:SDR family oxidoreductase [Sphingobacterium psychroaquaticum]SMG49763.1 dTDP-4-dehydrorhamnose reductase [Sphingobacterium psychroaquaticum]
MRILLTGSNGFLGQKLTDMLLDRNDVSLFCTSKSPNRNPNQSGYAFQQIALEDREDLRQAITSFKPTHIIHTAAMSSVEACEQEPERCQQVNVETPRLLAEIAAQHHIHYTFISTDFVFDGQNGPYRETDPTGPCNAYGNSKIKAETAVLAANPQAAILRTILVYGVIADKNRSNLILWAKSKLENKEPIQVVSDQWRMPTWVDDLARACILAAEKQAAGLYHISGDTLYSIIEVVQQVADYWQLDKSLIRPIAAETIGQAKNRPRTTGFILDKAKTQLGYTPTPLEETFRQMDIQLLKLQQS